jgi:hypothetical protein
MQPLLGWHDIVLLELVFESMRQDAPGQVLCRRHACWIDRLTSDPEGARGFYGGLFGWDLEVGPPETGNYT